MPYFTKITLTVIGLAMGLSLAGCKDDSEEDKSDKDAAVKCSVPGKSDRCTCANGDKSTRVCLSSGEYSDCDCAESKETCTTAGKQFDCECKNGTKGKRVCLATGVFSTCDCVEGAARCCNDLGSCMQSESLPKESVSLLGQDTCPGEGERVCVPDDFVAQTTPSSCHSINDSEGRCLPDCLPSIAEKKELLPQDTCPEHFLCGPCIDPITSHWTGACGLFDDPGQREPVKVFEQCCSGRGACVSADLVPTDLRSYVGQDSCARDQGLVCAPTMVIDNPDFVPVSCRSIGNAEGRCLPECLPLIVDRPFTFPQDICDDGLVCAPCYDNITGEELPTCQLPQDPGPAEPPVEYSRCCDNMGACVPEDLIPSNLTSSVGEDTCRPNQGLLCAPDVFTAHAQYVPKTCRSLSNAEGRCLPKCLPVIANQPVKLPQEKCPANFACAPCYDPRNGGLTGACNLPGDPGPQESPEYAARCCNGIGSCLPESLVSDEDASELKEGSCTPDQGLLCIPDVLLDTKTFMPKACRSVIDAEGRCLPDCVPMIEDSQVILPNEGCTRHFRCASCYHPVDGEETGACSFSTDKPTEPAKVFKGCCRNTDSNVKKEYLGSCVPKNILPTDFQATLPDTLCDDYSLVCAPADAAKNAPLVSCTTVFSVALDDLGFPGTNINLTPVAGVCLPKCIIDASAGRTLLNLTQSGCPSANDYCVPCDIAGGLVPNGCN